MRGLYNWLFAKLKLCQKHETLVINLTKQQELDSDPKELQQINFIGNLENLSTIIFIIEKIKESVLDFLQRTIKVL